jgi:hypothetical protein
MVAPRSTAPSKPTQQCVGKAITFYNPDMATLLLLAGFWGLPAMLHRSSKVGVGDEREDEHEMRLYMSEGRDTMCVITRNTINFCRLVRLSQLTGYATHLLVITILSQSPRPQHDLI